MSPSPSSPTVLILGATGRIGAATAQAFQQAGWRVLAQTRQPGAALPAGVQALVAAPEDTERLAREAAGAQVLVHALNPAYTDWERDAMRLLQHGIALARQLNARLLLPGNVYNYGRELPQRLNEATPQQADTRKGRIRVEMEEELARRAERGELRSTVIRAGDFFGAGTGTWLDLAIAKSLRQGRLVYPGPLDQAHAWAYLPDLAQTFVRVAQQPESQAHRRWHFGGHTLTGAQMLAGLEAAAARLGWTPPRGWRHGGMPWRFIRLAGRIWPMGRELAEMAYLWERPHALDGRALAAALGPLPVTPLDEALRQSLLTLGIGDRSPLHAAASA